MTNEALEAYERLAELIRDEIRGDGLGETMGSLMIPIRKAITESEWQDISSAPKDGTKILMGKSSVVKSDWLEAVGSYWGKRGNTTYNSFVRTMSGGTQDFKPSHWTPLPQPPQEIER